MAAPGGIVAAAAASCESCGWMAAGLSALAFGSFGVPIKCQAARRVRIDPLVFQSYKTAMCFLTCWPILLALRHFHLQEHDESNPSELFHFTPWGIVSGLFWVPGGVATVYAVQSAGLAMGIGIGSSFIVLVSFVWGVFVFREPIHSRIGATFAIACMMSGLLGMSYYSAPPHPAAASSSSPASSSSSTGHSSASALDDDFMEESSTTRTGRGGRHRAVGAPAYAVGTAPADPHHPSSAPCNHPRAFPSYSGVRSREDDDDENDSDLHGSNPRTAEDDGRVMPRREHLSLDFLEPVHRPGADAADDSDDDDYDWPPASSSPTGIGPEDSHSAHAVVVVLGCKVTRRQAGMLAALFCGVWGGSITAPMAYAPPEARGTGYLASFAIGSALVNFGLWVFRFLHAARLLYREQIDMGGGDDSDSAFAPVRPAVIPLLAAAYRTLPSFHLRVMWLPGGLAGLLWSIGNFFSLISVFYLGEGVGYPLVQTSILVSGLWGLFYYKEVTGLERRAKWFASSLLTIFGILLLSYEHHSA